jgi:hypothetical protein
MARMKIYMLFTTLPELDTASSVLKAQRTVRHEAKNLLLSIPYYYNRICFRPIRKNMGKKGTTGNFRKELSSGFDELIKS